MITLVTVIHVFACLFLILVVLLQAGKGGGMGIAFGSAGGAQQVFGGRGAGGFLEKMTAGTAIVFMLTSVTLAYHASKTESVRLQKISEDRKKKVEAEKAKEAKQNKEAEEAARKALEKEKAPPAAPAPPSTGAPATTGSAPTNSPPPSTAPAPSAGTSPSKTPTGPPSKK